MNTIETLRLLTETHGVSGNEKQIAALIMDLAKPYADEVYQDVMGNVIAHKKGPGPKIMFSAHMDSIGVIATHINKEGFVSFGTVGGFMTADLLQQTLQFENGVYALCCAKEEKISSAKIRDLYLDIGAENEAEAKQMIHIGDTAAYVSPLKQLSAHRVSGCYLDNRVGCLVQLMALEQVKAPANDLYFVFSVQEEVGTRGAKPAAFAIDPDYGIAVDVTCPDDIPGSEHDGTTSLGKGAAIKVMDRSVICSGPFVQQLRALAQEKGIPSQTDILKCGGTDAGPIRINQSGVVTGGISVPCRYTHTALEMCDLRDVDACIKLICAVCEKELPKV